MELVDIPEDLEGGNRLDVKTIPKGLQENILNPCFKAFPGSRISLVELIRRLEKLSKEKIYQTEQIKWPEHKDMESDCSCVVM